MVSARMNPRWKSVWITPAHSGAVDPARKVHARLSFSPVVRNVRSPSMWYAEVRKRGTAPSPRPRASSISWRSSASMSAASASSCTLNGTTSAPSSSARTGAAISSSWPIWSSPMLSTAITGLLVRRKNSLSSARSSAERFARYRGVPSDSRSTQVWRMATVDLSEASPLSMRLVLSSAFSAVARSANASSISTIRRCSSGSDGPGTSVSGKARRTNTIASTSRMWERNALPRPSP